MMNPNGIKMIVESTKDFYSWLAYGSGYVEDNDDALKIEVARVDDPIVFITDTEITQQFSILEDDSNGNTIREYGLAVAEIGPIASTLTYAPIEKNPLVFVLIQINTRFRNVVV